MTEPSSAQRRGRRIAMTTEELDSFLTSERTCRVATSTPAGPHLTALWFVWDKGSLWLYSLTRSKRWSDLSKDPRVAVLIDAGRDYNELRGAELRGRVEIVGEIPRTGGPHPDLDTPEELFARKYLGADTMLHDHRHAWLRLTPEQIVSWDFRKLALAA
jgi:pyridoxamine 5'-phosphate oxidase-like protein